MSGGTVAAKYKFTGKEEDKETGLYYYGARYYSPVLGRFLTVDPLQLRLHATPSLLTDPQSLNEYAYARNNPLRYVDPTGEFAVAAQALSNFSLRLAPYANTVISRAGQAVTLASNQVSYYGGQAINYGGQALNYVGDKAVGAYETTANFADESYNSVAQFFSGKSSNSPSSGSGGNSGSTGNWGPERGPLNKIKESVDSGLDKIKTNKGNFDISKHAKEKMIERSITRDEVINTINNNKAFKYFHENVLKTGFYDKASNIFVGKGDKITTVIDPKKGFNYIKSLIRKSK